MAEPSLALMLRRYEPARDRGWPTNEIEAAGKEMLRRDRRAPDERIYVAAMPPAASKRSLRRWPIHADSILRKGALR
jgi:hypothetical protein